MVREDPGIMEENDDGFWDKYVNSVQCYLQNMKIEMEEMTNCESQKQAREEYEKIQRSFDTILSEELHNGLVAKGERRLSHYAMRGALLIYFYCDQPRLSQPYQILTYLMDIDSLLTKWRYNHLMLVQRMLGNKQGTGGSSGYMYLRSTISDRYKVFLDLFNLSTWIIPREYIPPLSRKMAHRLSIESCATDFAKYKRIKSDDSDDKFIDKMFD